MIPTVSGTKKKVYSKDTFSQNTTDTVIVSAVKLISISTVINK